MALNQAQFKKLMDDAHPSVRAAAEAAIGKAKREKKEKGEAQRRAMSKTERSYQQRLAILQATGDVMSYRYEGVTLQLAEKTTYTPDFVVWFPLVVRRLVLMVEVKPRRSNGRAYWTEDSRVKVKCAAEQFGGQFEFQAVWPDGNGGWLTEWFSSLPK